MRGIFALATVLILSACCMPEPGDSKEIGTYLRGCWEATKGNKH